MTVTPTMVKELRERTGAGMMECKKALVETGADMDAAIEVLRKSGQAKADKKAGRVAAEGRIAVAERGKTAAIVEVNSETDFVAKDEHFTGFVEAVAEQVLAGQAANVEALMSEQLATGKSVEATRAELVAKVGENISVRRFARLDAADHLGSYTHLARIGVLVSLRGGDEELARDIAMHIAASNPLTVDESGVPADTLERERRIFTEQAQESGKPAGIVEKMVAGKVAKFLKEITLKGQPFVKDPDIAVGKLLDGRGATVTGFVRFEVGEGIEKKQENFVEEVMAQVRKGA